MTKGEWAQTLQEWAGRLFNWVCPQGGRGKCGNIWFWWDDQVEKRDGAGCPICPDCGAHMVLEVH